MVQAKETENMVKYQFTADDDDWKAWKDTVPRSKSLETRILELLEADTEGRVVDEDEAVNLDAVRADLERALENREWNAVEDALARLED